MLRSACPLWAGGLLFLGEDKPLLTADGELDFTEARDKNYIAEAFAEMERMIGSPLTKEEMMEELNAALKKVNKQSGVTKIKNRRAIKEFVDELESSEKISNFTNNKNSENNGDSEGTTGKVLGGLSGSSEGGNRQPTLSVTGEGSGVPNGNVGTGNTGGTEAGSLGIGGGMGGGSRTSRNQGGTEDRSTGASHAGNIKPLEEKDLWTDQYNEEEQKRFDTAPDSVRKLATPEETRKEEEKINALIDEAIGKGMPVVRRVTPQKFHETMAEVKANLGRNENSWMVDNHPVETEKTEWGENTGYADMKCFLTEDGQSGIAVKKDGDIVALFSNAHDGNRMLKLIPWAIQQGGTKLDCYDKIAINAKTGKPFGVKSKPWNERLGLPDLYARFGFKVTGKTDFNEEYAPEEWKALPEDKKVIMKYPVVAMRLTVNDAQEAIKHYQEYGKARKINIYDEKEVRHFDEYDEMMAHRDAELEAHKDIFGNITKERQAGGDENKPTEEDNNPTEEGNKEGENPNEENKPTNDGNTPPGLSSQDKGKNKNKNKQQDGQENVPPENNTPPENNGTTTQQEQNPTVAEYSYTSLKALHDKHKKDIYLDVWEDVIVGFDELNHEDIEELSPRALDRKLAEWAKYIMKEIGKRVNQYSDEGDFERTERPLGEMESFLNDIEPFVKIDQQAMELIQDAKRKLGGLYWGKDLFTTNRNSHRDLDTEEGRRILEAALYSPNELIKKSSRPNNWSLIHKAEGKHKSTVIEVSEETGFIEIVNWHYLKDDTLRQKENQVKREGAESSRANTQLAILLLA